MWNQCRNIWFLLFLYWLMHLLKTEKVAFNLHQQSDLGRECRNRRLENPGIAKKGGGVWPMPRFFGGFVEVSQKPYQCSPEWSLNPNSDHLPSKSEYLSPKIDHLQQLVNIYPKSNHSLPKMVIYALFTSKCRESHLRAFVVKSTRVPGLGQGGGGSSQSWQCQDFHGACSCNPSLTFSHSLSFVYSSFLLCTFFESLLNPIWFDLSCLLFSLES